MGLYAMTGGATGIGNAIKQQLLSQGNQVIVVDIKDADIIADLSTLEGRQAAVEGIAAAAPDGLDGFIPCAGVGPHISPPSMVARINFFGALAVTEGVKLLVAKKKGAIVMISSNSATMGYEQEVVDLMLAGNEAGASAKLDEIGNGQLAYGGGKYALSCWLRKASKAYAKSGIRLNAVAPGFTETPLTDAGRSNPEFAELLEEFIKSIPIGRPGLPKDIAEATCFLLDPEKAGFISGTILFVDGGHDAMLRPNSF
ncbi:MAG: hypothetical protein CL691_06095 [Cellvibrionales bacterium]|nr:hypothetical protein [Cellvibrionales bacterium]|tara:strand:+ start:15390 stop:16157 length:768 start_codon:yes stop_codon:yes gene_type:complete